MVEESLESQDVVSARGPESVISTWTLLSATIFPLPHNIFAEMGHAHIRWGGSKAQKYRVKSLALEPKSLAAWAKYYVEQWLSIRNLLQFLRYEGAVEWSSYGLDSDALQYAYVPHAGRASLDEDITVYHGTYWYCLWRILATATFDESDECKKYGHEACAGPGLYTSPAIDHALDYGWPANSLGDNLYYSVVFRLKAPRECISIARTKRKEVVLRGLNKVVIDKVYVFMNRPIEQGRAKNPVWLPHLELIPNGVSRPGALESSLLRPSAWYD